MSRVRMKFTGDMPLDDNKFRICDAHRIAFNGFGVQKSALQVSGVATGPERAGLC